jgi:hypothetical protein
LYLDTRILTLTALVLLYADAPLIRKPDTSDRLPQSSSLALKSFLAFANAKLSRNRQVLSRELFPFKDDLSILSMFQLAKGKPPKVVVK